MLTCDHCLFELQSSLDKAKAWIRELQRQADPNIIIALAGNKADLASSRRAIPTEVCTCAIFSLFRMRSAARWACLPHAIQFQYQDAERYATEENLLFLETSAKDSSNVSELFTMIARKLPLDQAANNQRGRGGSSLVSGGGQGGGQSGRGGVDLRGQQNQGDACAC